MKLKVITLLFVFTFALLSASAQHYAGIKNGYGIMGVAAVPSIKAQTVNSAFNPGLIYRYEHKKYAAIQFEFNYLSKGYLANDTTHTIYSYEIPMLAQGFIRFGRFRPYLTGGAFFGYIANRRIEVAGVRKDYITDRYDNNFEYGIIGGGGLGVSVWDLEIQAEWRYQYAFSFLRKPHISGKTQYFNATQMMISVGILYRLPLKSKK